MDKNLLQGVYTALITPMKDGEVFMETLKLINKQIAGSFRFGSMWNTGESPTLSKDEHLEAIRKTIEITGGKVPIIAGTGANSTKEALLD